MVGAQNIVDFLVMFPKVLLMGTIKRGCRSDVASQVTFIYFSFYIIFSFSFSSLQSTNQAFETNTEFVTG